MRECSRILRLESHGTSVVTGAPGDVAGFSSLGARWKKIGDVMKTKSDIYSSSWNTQIRDGVWYIGGYRVTPLANKAIGKGRESWRQGFGSLSGMSASTSLSRSMHSYASLGIRTSLVDGLSTNQRRALTWWLGLSSGWVFSMVVLGGVTRLTRSGLSMTDWKFTGEKPPQTVEEWTAEFERYKASPEYKRVNASMTLDEFKFIYWMEWAHRMWGRGLGIGFLVPCALFAWRGCITKPLASRLGLLFTMGGTQAFVGWWMVRSGLQEPESPHDIPRVSPYRLASHLTSAFAIYALMVWTTLSTAFPVPLSVGKDKVALSAISKLRSKAIPFAALLSVTALSGAFVAGLDAGHAYNTFPLMDGKLVPAEYWSEKYKGWRNMFENTAAVQFHHRILALSTLLGSLGLWKYGMGLSSLPRSPRLLLHGLLVGSGLQVTLGISTLLTYVPVSLGAAHQAGALSLFTVSLALLHSLRSRSLNAWQTSLSRVANPASAAMVIGIGGLAAYSS